MTKHWLLLSVLVNLFALAASAGGLCLYFGADACSDGLSGKQMVALVIVMMGSAICGAISTRLARRARQERAMEDVMAVLSSG